MAVKQDKQELQNQLDNKDNLINQFQQENNQQKAIITRKNVFINRQQQKIIDLRKDKTDLQVENKDLAQQISNLKQDKQNLQTWKDNHNCSLTCQSNCCINNDYDAIKAERILAKTQLGEKNWIIEELRNKPPLQPINNLFDSESKEPLQTEPNNFLTEKEELLNTIKQQKETIQKLQAQLKNASERERKIDWEDIKQLQEKVRDKEKKLAQFCFYWLLSLVIVIGVWFLFSIMSLLVKKPAARSYKTIS